jgi:hypothetical protein
MTSFARHARAFASSLPVTFGWPPHLSFAAVGPSSVTRTAQHFDVRRLKREARLLAPLDNVVKLDGHGALPLRDAVFAIDPLSKEAFAKGSPPGRAVDAVVMRRPPMRDTAHDVTYRTRTQGSSRHGQLLTFGR